MGFVKLREWVGTVTGKGDRWGRDSVGRSAPAFMVASISALPPLTCTARERPTSSSAAVVRCEAGYLWPFVMRPEPGGESAGCVCLRCCSAGFLLPATLCLPCPLPFSTVAPVQLLCPVSSFCSIVFCLPPVPSMCARIVVSVVYKCQHVCKLQDCPVGSNNAGLQWRPAHRAVFFAPWPVRQDCL